MRRRLARLCAALALAGACLAGPAATTAPAGCGGVRHARPHRIDFAHRPPLAIGDSTMLLAVHPLGRAGIEANARGCRQISEGLGLIARRRRERRLPRVVIVALGANWRITSRDVRKALRIIGPRRILVLVTPREAGGGSGSDARVERAAGRRYPRRVRVLDWVRQSAGHGAYFSGDGLHLSFKGVDAFVALLRRARTLN